MAQFVNLDGNILPKPKGFDYDLIPNKLYDLVNYYSPRLKENGEFNLPKTIYDSKKDIKFRKRVLTHFHKETTKTCGILLAGEKGTGKSIQAKLIAQESGLPIINVPNEIERNALLNFFKSFDTPVCIIFDEFEKYFNTTDLLCLLDGIERTTKMLVICTCNDINQISEYLKDRCSRIRYVRKFTNKDNLEYISQLITELGIQKYENELNTYCQNHLVYPTIDNVKALITEYKDLLDSEENVSIEEVSEFLNISTK